MKRLLVWSPAFKRDFKRYCGRDTARFEDVATWLRLLEADPTNPLLKAHKLKGKLDGVWSLKVGYDLRILYEHVEHEGRQAIHLLAIGTHDDVY